MKMTAMSDHEGSQLTGSRLIHSFQSFAISLITSLRYAYTQLLMKNSFSMR